MGRNLYISSTGSKVVKSWFGIRMVSCVPDSFAIGLGSQGHFSYLWKAFHAVWSAETGLKYSDKLFLLLLRSWRSSVFSPTPSRDNLLVLLFHAPAFFCFVFYSCFLYYYFSVDEKSTVPLLVWGGKKINKKITSKKKSTETVMILRQFSLRGEIFFCLFHHR